MSEPFYQCDRATLYQGDCLSVMPQLEPQSFDAIICDLPYGSTACSWDSIIPFEPLWECYKRLIKPNGAIVLFASQPFTSMLVMSNVEWFKYCWVWEKDNPSNFGNVEYMPMKYHEDICVFGKETIKFNPQMRDAGKVSNIGGFKTSSAVSFKTPVKSIPKNTTTFRYPSSIIRFDRPKHNSSDRQVHPTQKPVALLRFLIRSYTNPGDLILDNTMGSGSTGVAAVMEGRKFVGIEQDADFCAIGKQRITDALTEVDSMLIKPWELPQVQGAVHEQTELFGGVAV